MFPELSAFIKDSMTVHPVLVNVCILGVAILGGLLVNLITRHIVLYGMKLVFQKLPIDIPEGKNLLVQIATRLAYITPIVVVYILLVILAVFAAAGAQILLKKGATKEYAPLWKQYVNPWVIGGYAIMGLSLLLNVFCMGHGVQAKEVSTIESLSYLFVPCLAWLFFRERLSWRKAGAIAVILIGVFVFFI